MSDLTAGLKSALAYAQEYAAHPKKWRAPSGPQFRKLRQSTGVTLRTFAQRHKISERALRRFEQGLSTRKEKRAIISQLISSDA